MKLRLVSCLALLFPASVFAAGSGKPPVSDTAYVQVTNERAEKIVAKLGISDPAKSTQVRDVIAQFYRDLNALQGERDTRIKAAKADASLSKEQRESNIKAARTDIDAKREVLRQAFVQKLSAELTPEQLDEVKDGLTYGVLPLTFRVYQEMLPNLTAEQKNQIHAWLVEAREHAVDGFTSEEKHGWFGKYKGRINNYLSKAGYNMKDAERALSAKHPETK